MQDQLNEFLKSAKKIINSNQSEKILEKIRIDYLGKNGKITALLKSVGHMPINQRPLLGKAINEVRREIQQLLKKKSVELREKLLQEKINREKIDVTLPGRYDEIGTLHPITQVSERVSQLFSMLGFQITEGPEIEDEYYNFEALNISANHPARTTVDTFYFWDNKLLRTHTSPVQIREMEKQGVPIRLIALGRVYRRDLDKTHTPMFHQVEGLVVDKHSTFSTLKGLLQKFLNCFFEKDMRIRFRPSYFPFTEPSAEVDVYQLCANRWLEVLGCGMIHPNVLRNLKIDPDEYGGFAFGIGLDRLAMLRYKVSDLRLFFENDLRFLGQF